MDFRLCPSCKQSVLDDDAAECPFCGASMSGKGGATKKPSAQVAAKPAAKPPASTVTAKQPAASSKTATPKAPSKPSSNGDVEVDPFAVDENLRKKTPQGRAKPAKGCSYEVKCPMCGTVAYVPEKYAGKDIRCLNDACMLGVYKVPFPEAVVVEEKKQGFFQKNWLWLTIAAIVIGGCVTGYLLVENSKIKAIVDTVPNPNPNPNPKPPEPKPVDDKILVDDKDKLLHISEQKMLVKLFTDLPSDIRQTTTPDYKAAGLQMLSLLYLKTGQLAEANKTITNLVDSATLSKSFRIHPYAELAFYYLALNKPKEAEEAVGKALNAWNASEGEWHGRIAASGSIPLMASLIATNRISDAESILNQLQNASRNRDNVGLETAAFQSAFDAGYFDLNIELMKRLPYEIGNKISMSVTQLLEIKGQHNAALKWCDAAQSPGEKFVRKLELIRTMAFPPQVQKQEIKIDSAKPVIEQLSQREQALIWAHLGRIAQELQQADVATQCLQTADNLVKQLAKLEPIPLPDIAQIYYKQFNYEQQKYDATITTLAVTELAILKQKLLKKEEAWQNFQDAINIAKLASPDYGQIAAKIDVMTNNDSAVRKELEDKLKIKSVNSRTAFNDYRRNIQPIQKDMDDSQKLLATVAVEAVKAGLHDEVYQWYKEGEGHTLNEAGMLKPQVPGALWIAMRIINDQARGTELTTLKLAGKAVPPADWDTQKQAEGYTNMKQFNRIASSLNKNISTNDLQMDINTTMYVSRREAPAVFVDWLKEIRSNDEYREKTLQFGSAMYAIRGDGVDFYNTLMKSTPPANEKIFAVRGLIQGLLQKGIKPEPENPAPK